MLLSLSSKAGIKYPANFENATPTAAMVAVCITAKKLHPYKNPASGLYASLVYKYVEFGEYIFRPTWDMNVPDFAPLDCGHRYNLTVIHDARIQTTQFVSVGYKNVWISVYRDVTAKGDRYQGINLGRAFKLEYRFDFK